MRRNRSEGNPFVHITITLGTIAVGAVIFLTCSLAMSQTGNSTSSNDPASGWKQVEDAMGRAGQIQPGDVIKFGMPRKDLHVVLNGVDIKPGLALGSWAAFKRDGTGVIVMGDLVLTEDEVEPVMMKLQEGGIQESALHKLRTALDQTNSAK